MGMADQHGMSLRVRQSLGLGEPGMDRISLDDMVEEDIAPQNRQSETFSDGVTATIGDGHGIDEERALFGNRAERDTHRPRITGKTATHMIIQADRAGHPRHRPANTGPQITIAEINAQGMRPRIGQAERFHRHMHQNIAATGLRSPGGCRGSVGIGQNGKGQRCIEGQYARRSRFIQPDIINDQGDAWPCGNRAAGERGRNRQADGGRADRTGGRQAVHDRHSGAGLAAGLAGCNRCSDSLRRRAGHGGKADGAIRRRRRSAADREGHRRRQIGRRNHRPCQGRHGGIARANRFDGSGWHLTSKP